MSKKPEKFPTDKTREERDLIADVESDFLKRQKERLILERQWELNMNFLNGNQYCGISGRGEIVAEDKNYFWQNRSVFNHIAPIMETRLSKLARVRPTVFVRPQSDDDKDVASASAAEKLIENAFKTSDLSDVAKRVTAWSEICGTGFYKVIWNNDGGNEIGSFNGKRVFEGDVEILAVSPFEIFPDNLYSEKLENCGSIIHAKAVPVRAIKQKYGVLLAGGDVDVYDLTFSGAKTTGKKQKKTLSDSALVIERYESPTEEFPNGRFISVAGGKLLFSGELPYKTDAESAAFPFVKQESLSVSGSFFGTSVIERLIPVQRAYNAVKNRKHEFLNRLSNGVMTVEDGSVDVNDLEGEGLPPGKILVYRQGAKAPEMMTDALVPPDFSDEETKLVNEFVTISGVSDVSSSSKNANMSSGSALQLLISQDNERLTMTAENVRRCFLDVARQSLRLYREFSHAVRAVRYNDGLNKTKIFYADKRAAESDDVYLESENELSSTPMQKKETILKLYESGVLCGDDGKISSSTKEKVLSLLGYKDLDYRKGITRLQEEKAESENASIRSFGAEIEVIDDDAVHIDEHTRYVLSEYEELTAEEKDRFFTHIQAHKDRIKQIKQENENFQNITED